MIITIVLAVLLYATLMFYWMQRPKPSPRPIPINKQQRR
jgi:hypothetical protein